MATGGAPLATGSELYFLLDSGDRVEQVAGELAALAGGQRCLLLRGRPSRVVQLGAMPDVAELRAGQLVSHGFDRQQITILDIQGDAAWDAARELGSWLQQNPRAEVLLLCDAFSSRHQRAIVRAAMRRRLAARIRLLPRRDRRFDESNWWRSRLGVRHVAGNCFSLACFYLFDERTMDRPYMTPEEYEGSLKSEGGGKFEE